LEVKSTTVEVYQPDWSRSSTYSMRS